MPIVAPKTNHKNNDHCYIIELCTSNISLVCNKVQDPLQLLSLGFCLDGFTALNGDFHFFHGGHEFSIGILGRKARLVQMR